MKTCNLRLALLLLCGLFSGLMCEDARAQKIPALAAVSPKLPEAEQQAFRQKSAELEAALKAFTVASDRFNAKPAKDQSDAEFDALTAERERYIAAARQYNTEMALRVRAVESGDPMVVNARDVPTGLPPEVDAAIAEAFSAAPPGVAKAVSKGYQAVMAHDWNVAQACFGDALYKYPGDAGLVRLVDLSRYMLQRQRDSAAGRIPAAAETAASTAAESARLKQAYQSATAKAEAAGAATKAAAQAEAQAAFDLVAGDFYKHYLLDVPYHGPAPAEIHTPTPNRDQTPLWLRVFNIMTEKKKQGSGVSAPRG